MAGGSEVRLCLPLPKIRSFRTLPRGVTAKILPGGAVQVLAGENHPAHPVFKWDFACPTAPGQLWPGWLRKANSYQLGDRLAIPQRSDALQAEGQKQEHSSQVSGRFGDWHASGD